MEGFYVALSSAVLLSLNIDMLMGGGNVKHINGGHVKLYPKHNWLNFAEGKIGEKMGFRR